MSPAAQSLALAGIQFGKDNYRVKLLAQPQPNHYRWTDKLIPTPDYLSDLNAIAEVEKVLTEMERRDYHTKLHEMTGGWAVFATAPQRSEALLRTLNLWDDSK